MSPLEALQHFSGAYLATLAIGLVCAYLGLFTVLRRIVFTGVALAQLAAAGVAAAFFAAPLLPEAWAGAAARHGATVGSLGAAIGGALGLELGRGSERQLAPDARVGLAYAASSALAVLFVWRSPHGLAELRNILAGEVLLARQEERASLYLGLAAIALVHAVYRQRFWLVSFDPELARALGLPARRLTLLLTATLAAAVALALKAGGLLLVFAFLLAPALSGLALGRRLGEATRLALAAACGASLAGFLTAVAADLPVAPTIACALLVQLALAWAAARRPGSAAALRALVYCGGATALAAGLVAALAPQHPEPPAEPPRPPALSDPHAHEHAPGLEATHPEPSLGELVRALEEGATAALRADAAHHLEDLADARALLPLVAALGDPEPEVARAAAAAIACLAAQPGVRERLRAAARAEDPERRVHAALALLRVGELEGARALIEALADPAVPLFAKDGALAALRPLAGGDDLGYDPFAEPAHNEAALASWRRWWEERGARLHWEPAQERFVPPK